MGADVYLRSVCTDEVMEFAASQIEWEWDDLSSAHEVMNEYYEQLAETEGYFRDPHNEYSMLCAIGLDWSRDVGPMLDKNGKMPIEGARHLLAEIEARPITPAMVDDVLAGRGTPHPVVAFMRKMQEELGNDVQIGGLIAPGEIDATAFLAHLTKRRGRLMALLRRSIELGEPLECSI